MSVLFELKLTNTNVLSSFCKTCEALFLQSDTVMFKVKKRGVYIMLTDSESFCAAEGRLTENVSEMLSLYCEEFTCKILLNSLTKSLKQIVKKKRGALLYSDTKNQLKVKEINSGVNVQRVHVYNTFTVESTEHRPRVYHILSTNKFRVLSDEYYTCFKMPTAELNKLITAQCIMSGNCGGVGELNVIPVANFNSSTTTQQTQAQEQEQKDRLLTGPSNLKNRVLIEFTIRNQSGNLKKWRIYTHTRSKQVPVLQRSVKHLRVEYFLTYLKRAQSMFTSCSNFVKFHVSHLGIMLETEKRDHHYVVMFLTNVKDVDKLSYCGGS